MGETLTADTSGIADADGLSDISYAYQWIRTDGGTDTDIAGATDSAYTLTGDDLGKTVKLKVTFTDDKGNSETLSVVAASDVGESEQKTQFLVSNLGINVATGIMRPLSAARSGFAQAFTTGTKTGGYALGSVGIQVSDFSDGSTVGDHLQVTINGVTSEGEPGDAHCTLTNPSSFSTPGVIAFEAPAGEGSCPQLTTETTYVVVIEWVNPSGTGSFALIPQTYPTEETAATEEDPGGAEGWSIADRSYYLAVSSDARTWTAYDETASFKIEVKEAAAKANTLPTGLPTISGTAQVGETLTADTTAIADEDGLTNVSYSYQWIADDGNSDADIEEGAVEGERRQLGHADGRIRRDGDRNHAHHHRTDRRGGVHRPGQGGERCRRGSALGGGLRDTAESSDMVRDPDGGDRRRDIRRLHDVPAGSRRSGRSLVRRHHVGRRQLHRQGPGGSERQADSLSNTKAECRVRTGGRYSRIRLRRRIDPGEWLSLTVPVERPGIGLVRGAGGRRQADRAGREHPGHR